MSKKNNTPHLRFPGFTGEWEEKKLGNFCELRNGYAFKSDSYVTNGKYNIVTIANVQNGQLNINSVNTINDLPENIVEHQKLKIGDIILSMTGNVGRVCIVDKANCLLNQRVGLIEQVSNEIDRRFLYCLINSPQFESEMIKSGQGAAQANISKTDIESFSFFLSPNPEEQRKIAECLTEIDETISAQAEKVELLKIHKKGLMQQLFPQDGETTPKLRFPEFEGEWEEKKFKDFTFAVGKKNRQNLPYDRYSISNEKGFYPQDEQFEGGAGYLKNIDCKMYIIVPPKSFAYNPARINIGSIGYQNLGKDVIVSSLYEVFQVDNTCDDSFLWHWFHSDVFRKMVLDVQEGGVRQYFFYEKLKECSINLPSKKEQQTITSFLSDFDNLIAAESDKLEILKNYKKGLMQQLFPQPVK